VKDSKYYSFSEVIKMLPLLKAYAQDIRLNHEITSELTEKARKFAKLTSMNELKKCRINKIKKLIKDKIQTRINRLVRWQEELKELYITICSPRHGRIDVPIYDDSIESVIVICVNPQSEEKEIEWHIQGENCEQARKYWESAKSVLIQE
jgi:hypothetical protein